MGWGYFHGYEVMVLALGLLLYGLVPWASVYVIGRRKKEYTVLSPLVYALILILFARIFLFLFSAAQMDRVFDLLYQLPASAAVITLYWIYQLRGQISCKGAGVRWGVCAAMGLVSGLSAGICGLAAFYISFAAFGLRYPSRIPHSGPAYNIFLLLLLAYYLAALLISRAAMRGKEKLVQPIVFIAVSVLGCVLVYNLYFVF